MTPSPPPIPAAMFAACEAAGVATTLAECTSILAASDISDESDPLADLERIGQRLIPMEEGAR